MQIRRLFLENLTCRSMQMTTSSLRGIEWLSHRLTKKHSIILKQLALTLASQRQMGLISHHSTLQTLHSIHIMIYCTTRGEDLVIRNGSKQSIRTFTRFLEIFFSAGFFKSACDSLACANCSLAILSSEADRFLPIFITLPKYAASALGFIANMIHNEIGENDDVQSLANIMRSLMEFINGEITEMVNAAKQGEGYEKSEKIPAQVKINSISDPTANNLNLSYVKSLGIDLPTNKLAVKYVGKNTIAHPVFIWGDNKKTDLELEFFTKSSDFWDEPLKDFSRPLTWEHGQDEKFAKIEDTPVIGKTVKYYDDDIARWAESVITTDKQYRKYIDQFIEEKRLGYSSDSAPQYVQREKQGKATWLKAWPWFGGALTSAPCEPRMKTYTPEFIKSLGIVVPVVSNEMESEMAIMDYLRIKNKI